MTSRTWQRLGAVVVMGVMGMLTVMSCRPGSRTEALITHLPAIDVYTGSYLSKKHFSLEHMIPKRFFHERAHANDLLNLVPCDRKVNQLRSDYRYGTLTEHVVHDKDSIVLTTGRNEVSGYLSRRHRTFYPATEADCGLIGRSIIRLLYKYPYLYSYLDDIIDRPDTLWRWSCFPTTSFFEDQRELYINSLTMWEEKKICYLKTKQTI